MEINRETISSIMVITFNLLIVIALMLIGFVIGRLV
jgi:preprotein translocase subunit SecE